ncbi:MAG: hypothetical protein FP815_11725 [Desulfobulbaceae bacterium]|nr:hypothetical protein [Desulfobulbaceae bacterium]
MPFEQVAQSIKDKILADKKAKRKQALIDALSSRSTVTINDEVWVALAKELVPKVSTTIPAE